MQDHLTPQVQTSKQVDAKAVNDAPSYISQCPRWWHPQLNPPQVTKVTEAMLFLLPVGNPGKIPGLLPWGPPGMGKTSGALGVLYAWGKAGKHCRFQDFQEFMVKVRSSWRRDAPITTENLLEEMFKPDLLLLDDIGKRATPEDQETCSVLYNGRINRGKPTIATTNLMLNTEEGIKNFKEACDSRVLERFRNLDMDGSKFGENLRKELHKGGLN